MSELVTYVTGFPKFVFIFDHFLEHLIFDVAQLEGSSFFSHVEAIENVRSLCCVWVWSQWSWCTGADTPFVLSPNRLNYCITPIFLLSSYDGNTQDWVMSVSEVQSLVATFRVCSVSRRSIIVKYDWQTALEILTRVITKTDLSISPWSILEYIRH